VRAVRPYYLAGALPAGAVPAGELLRFDLWQPSDETPVGFGQTRKGFVVLCALGCSRFGAGALVFSKDAPDILAGGGAACARSAGCRGDWSAIARARSTQAAGAHRRRSPASVASARRAADARSGRLPGEGVVERPQGFMANSFEQGRRFVNELDFQDQLDRWFSERANARSHRTLRERPIDRLARERERLRPLPERPPDTDRRLVLRVPPQPYVHVDRNDYSLDPRFVGRRVELRASQRELVRGRARHR
jgi:hypothetical protein